ncbi:hypothetical protein ABK040_014267 [Willaertia magna]
MLDVLEKQNSSNHYPFLSVVATKRKDSSNKSITKGNNVHNNLSINESFYGSEKSEREGKLFIKRGNDDDESLNSTALFTERSSYLNDETISLNKEEENNLLTSQPLRYSRSRRPLSASIVSNTSNVIMEEEDFSETSTFTSNPPSLTSAAVNPTNPDTTTNKSCPQRKDCLKRPQSASNFQHFQAKKQEPPTNKPKRPGSAPLRRDKSSSELYNEQFEKKTVNDEAFKTLSNPWRQTMSSHYNQPLIQTILQGRYLQNQSPSKRKKVDYIKKNMEAIHEKSVNNNNQKRKKEYIVRPKNYTLNLQEKKEEEKQTRELFVPEPGEFFTTLGTTFEHNEVKESQINLTRKLGYKQSIPRAINSRTVYNPSQVTFSKENIRIRPKSAQDSIRYKETQRHVDVVTACDKALLDQDYLEDVKSIEQEKRPLYKGNHATKVDDPIDKNRATLKIKGFSINSVKVSHESSYKPPKPTKRGLPPKPPSPHVVAVARHNSRFSMDIPRQ